MCEVCRNRGDDDAGLDRNQVDANEGQAYPRVDDDPLVEDAIENIDLASGAGGALDGHRQIPFVV